MTTSGFAAATASVFELIAVAIAVEKGCGDCIIFHVADAKQQGATREELSEALVVCIVALDESSASPLRA